MCRISLKKILRSKKSDPRKIGLSSIAFTFTVTICHYDRGYFFYNQCSIYFFFITKLYFLIFDIVNILRFQTKIKALISNFIRKQYTVRFCGSIFKF